MIGVSPCQPSLEKQIFLKLKRSMFTKPNGTGLSPFVLNLSTELSRNVSRQPLTSISTFVISSILVCFKFFFLSGFAFFFLPFFVGPRSAVNSMTVLFYNLVTWLGALTL